MSAFVIVRLMHVLAAVLGVGLVAASGLVARASTGPHELLILSRWSSVALLVMLATGIGMNVIAGGAYQQAWWFRLSALSLLATGATVGLGRRQLRRWARGDVDVVRARRHATAAAWTACALVTWITVLMELRPFQ